ncbi:phenoloxidase-activating factor 2-like [Bicyclus anynana]|uniref:Phenoloxidase-activating factor 2-like n=1 Tax=Bicyclus anynana TaxID=110368 RepID=A0ABM3M2I3_BICAN|nr:phenoloxidase-activating factor 2-like [Bicyclus anynana]
MYLAMSEVVRVVLWLTLVSLSRAAQDTISSELLRQIFGDPEPQANPAQTVTSVDSSSLSNCTTSRRERGVCVADHLCDVDRRDYMTRTDCPSLEVCCRPQDVTDQMLLHSPKPMREGCGWGNPYGLGMSTQGADNEAKFGEFPWMVAIYRIEPIQEDKPDGRTLNVYSGGGSLIHPSAVLTAAHKVAPLTNSLTRVRAGEWAMLTTDEPFPHQDRDIVSIAVHEKFNKGNLFYDIAVMFLTQPMDLAPNVQLACLPPPRTRVPGGARCLACGWGKDKFGKEGQHPNTMKKVAVPVVEHVECARALRGTRLGHYFRLHSSFMCAGGEPGVDVCAGDGGAPLVCPIENAPDRYMQSGIVAWGIGCGEDGTPGVYVDVSNLRDWVDFQVLDKGLDPQMYTYN